MKTILAAVNSQYIHSNLAVWQLKANCPADAGDVAVREYHINQQLKWVYQDILDQAPDVVAFSCYIWNIEFVLKLAEDLKAAAPSCLILLGGPEVSFDYQQLLRTHPFVDGIFVGEGEHTFSNVLTQLHHNLPLESEGLCLQSNIRPTAYVTEPDLNALADPYTQEMLEATKGKILYFEGSRGCPFSCSYCLSQISHGVRNLSLERIEETLLRLEQSGVELVKFVDRTFNCDTRRAVAIWQFAAARLHTLKLHFEIGADLLNEAQQAALAALPTGSVQLEAGVQSVNPQTLGCVCRKMDLERLKENVQAIVQLDKVHCHLDLIAGLPYEDYNSFAHSFDWVFALRPHQLQLGFLKMIKGSKIRSQAEEFGYRYRSYPPYEVVSTACLSASEMNRLAQIEEMVERYYNSGRFALSLEWLLNKWNSPFRLFEALAAYLSQQCSLGQSVAAGRHFTMLFEYGRQCLTAEESLTLRELLRCDYYLSGLKGTLPQPLANEAYRYTKPYAEAFYTQQLFFQYGLLQPLNKKELFRQYLFLGTDVNPFLPVVRKKTLLLIDTAKKSPVSGRYFSQIVEWPSLQE